MTYAQMIKRVNEYNELAAKVGEFELELRVKIGFSMYETVKETRSFAKFIRDEYIEEMAKAILGCKDYDFDETTTLTIVDRYGDELRENVEFYLCTV